MKPDIRRLGPADLALMRELNAVYADAFEDHASYTSTPPSDDYVRKLLLNDSNIVLVAVEEAQVCGGLVAYVLPKFEQARSEIYIYDLAVTDACRRRGIATALIEDLRARARELDAWAIYVQADHGDDPAIALYTKLGARENVVHFDIVP